jgi:hypothetical protein
VNQRRQSAAVAKVLDDIIFSINFYMSNVANQYCKYIYVSKFGY